MSAGDDSVRTGQEAVSNRGIDLVMLAMILAFGVISFWNLGRFPAIHEDEPWLLSPGFKLFTKGVYG